jgi:hypothetical protein
MNLIQLLVTTNLGGLRVGIEARAYRSANKLAGWLRLALHPGLQLRMCSVNHGSFCSA